jgi:hypothetical protein
VVTGSHLATAYRDATARSILLLARDARMRQDSALVAYDATTYQRVSAGIGFRKLGRDRLAFRSEGATRVRWRRGVGAYVDVTGSRTVVPIAGKSGHVDIEGSLSPIPYYPGSETLWIGASAARQAVDENEGIIHPLAEGPRRTTPTRVATPRRSVFRTAARSGSASSGSGRGRRSGISPSARSGST